MLLLLRLLLHCIVVGNVERLQVELIGQILWQIGERIRQSLGDEPDRERKLLEAERAVTVTIGEQPDARELRLAELRFAQNDRRARSRHARLAVAVRVEVASHERPVVRVRTTLARHAVEREQRRPVEVRRANAASREHRHVVLILTQQKHATQHNAQTSLVEHAALLDVTELPQQRQHSLFDSKASVH